MISFAHLDRKRGESHLTHIQGLLQNMCDVGIVPGDTFEQKMSLRCLK
jgi:hypothetical protein